MLLHYIALRYVTLHYRALYGIILHCMALYCMLLHCTNLVCSAVEYLVLKFYCSVPFPHGERFFQQSSRNGFSYVTKEQGKEKLKMVNSKVVRNE